MPFGFMETIAGEKQNEKQNEEQHRSTIQFDM
jgi:hypothetical protein